MPRCPECPGKFKCILPDGPATSNILLIGEAPGINEDKKGQVFIGKTGQELDRGYLPICNLRRENVRIINAISCLPDTPGGKLDPNKGLHQGLLKSCAETNLYPEIRRKRWDVIVPMGSFACRALEPEIDLELHHGFPIESDQWGTLFPMYHPAGGIHEPKKMLQIRTDWIRLNKFLKGKLKVPIDPFAGAEQYELIESSSYLRSILSGYRHHPLACDTETTRQKKPFCLSFSTEPGTGFVVKAEDLDCLGALQEELDSWQGPILWHNWLFDRDVVRKMGLVFPERLVRDTMLMAFHLGNIPQGLKALAFRELGMTMLDFDDLVTPHSRPIVLDYYRDCGAEDWGRPEPELRRDDKTGQWKMYKPQGFNALLKRFWTDYGKAVANGTDKDVFKMWTENWGRFHGMIEERLGPWPGKCISHAAKADWPATLRYACRDADATVRLYSVLKKMQRQVRRKPQEHWSENAYAHTA